MFTEIWPYLLIAAIAAAIGGTYVAAKYEADIAERNTVIAQQNLEIEGLVREQQKNLQHLADDTALILDLDHDTLDKEFDAALSRFDLHIGTYGDLGTDNNSGGVREDTASPDQPLPDPAPVAAGDNRAGQCKCTCPDRAKLRRLYEQQLKVARDCDISDQHRKRVIELYEGLRNELER